MGKTQKDTWQKLGQRLLKHSRMRPFQIQPKRKKSGQRGKGENRASSEKIYKRLDHYAERDLWKEETPDLRGVYPRTSQLEKTAKGIKSSKLCKRPRAVIDKTYNSRRAEPTQQARAQTPTPSSPIADEAEGRTSPSMDEKPNTQAAFLPHVQSS